MQSVLDREAIAAVRAASIRMVGGPQDFSPLLALTGDARYVLIGEASHGTHEFYRIRAEITKQLIRDHGFRAVAVEADWPDAYLVNRYVRGRPVAQDATEALGGFRRFPQWMWRNADVLDFIGWLREYNDGLEDDQPRVGFYGLDIYSLHTSIQAVLAYLRLVDPVAARRAERRYACFDHFGGDPQVYGRATTLWLEPSCEAEVIGQLVELRAKAADYAHLDGRIAEDDLFFAAQNAKVVAAAESYYREMFRSGSGSWNLRDRHMVDTLHALGQFLEGEAPGAKVVVWAHNSHLGDARKTSMGLHGEVNVGQLVRERAGDQAVLVGFTTYTGTVTAASDWDAPVERKHVRPALSGSYEALFHDCGQGNFFLDLRSRSAASEALADQRLERAIGVIYRPETERQSHYFHASLSGQFDAVFHYDHTRAVEPLDRTAIWDRGQEMPETYPSTL
ncbi:MAG TPA: erythromycin esterase family protein [Gemmatimonadales bacterium]|jgi:erythromycin esterase-like protein